MRLTVLGSSASYAGPGRACAGYLVESAAARLVLDCGNGALANLGAVLDPLEVDAVAISHRHPDHFLDLYAYQALLRYAPEGPAPAKPVFGPPGLRELMQGVLGEHGRGELEAAFRFGELTEGGEVRVGDLAVTARAVAHVPGSFALRVSDGEATLGYTADARLDDTLVAAMRGCDLLLAEATLPEEYAGKAPHMTAREAGTLAREAGAGELVLTHIWPTNDRGRTLAEAETVFGGRVSVAEELAAFEVDATADRGER